MRNTLLLLVLILMGACKAEKEEVRVNPFTQAYAGQYLIRPEGKASRTVSERYILSPTGQAEKHRLTRNSIYGEYRLDSIIRGHWEAEDGRISISLEDPRPSAEIFLRDLRQNPADSLQTDTLWMASDGGGRRLELLIRF